MLTDSKIKVHNFSAGPSILPKEVIDKAADALHDFAGTGLSLLEVSHRGKEFEAAMAKAQQLVKELLGVPEHYAVLFLQGGASLGFLKTPLNFMKEGGKAAYANTGEWATRAIKEAKGVGNVEVVAS
ncbi:MAG TPA: aminotransferase class V-fold PLP-dependent enzyme, partial [Flavobacteriales bacterium]|nr:aminotransferase class V-fold PLP-dependent enzyme [Flavobacteriales bacterium]